MILMLAGCFGNSAPRLVSFNGAPIDLFEPTPVLEGAAGDDLTIEIEVTDAEKDPIRVWFPGAPDGFEFDPDGTSGVWHVADDPPVRYLDFMLVLEDQNPERHATREYGIAYGLSGVVWDTSVDTGEGEEVPAE